jgi:hypothetical protein
LKSYASRSPLLRILVAAFALCPVGCGQQDGAKSAVTPKAVADDIRSHGAAAVVKELNAGSGIRWHDVIRGIETGSTAWLDVAKMLLTATDAGRTTDLYFALSLALTRNANGVLLLVGPNLPIDTVCSVPQIEPDKKTVTAHRAKVHSALLNVKSADLEPLKKACLDAIDR